MSKFELEIITNQEGDVTIAEIDGPIDSATFDQFKEKLDPFCTRAGAKVILDCERLTYLNSRAIGLLVKYHRTLMLTRGRMVICSMNNRIVRTLDLMQLGKTLFTCENRDKAMDTM